MVVWAIRATVRGEVVRLGTCSQACFDASDPRCTCVCGGSNHGRHKVDGFVMTRTASIRSSLTQRLLAEGFPLEDIEVEVTFQDDLIAAMEAAAAASP